MSLVSFRMRNRNVVSWFAQSFQASVIDYRFDKPTFLSDVEVSRGKVRWCPYFLNKHYKPRVLRSRSLQMSSRPARPDCTSRLTPMVLWCRTHQRNPVEDEEDLPAAKDGPMNTNRLN